MFSCVCTYIAGVAWLAFGGYTNYGEDVWGRRLNYYLIPVMVSELRPVPPFAACAVDDTSVLLFLSSL